MTLPFEHIFLLIKLVFHMNNLSKEENTNLGFLSVNGRFV